MSGSYFSLMDMAIAGIPVTLFCIWQLVSVNREIGKDRKAKPPPPPPPPSDSSPESARHSVGEHRLDDR